MQLLRDQIVVRPSVDEDEVTTASGIVLTGKVNPFLEGEVVATGEYAGRALDGTTIESKLKPGDLVLYRRGAGEDFSMNGEVKLKLMTESNVIAVLETANA